MNGIIVYQGKYGATEQYARWLSHALRIPMLNAKLATPSILADFDVVILGSSVYVGRMVINHWVNQNLELLKHKKVFLFVVCGTTSDNPSQQQEIINNNVDPAIRENCEVFFLHGRCVVSKLSWIDRLILKMGTMREKDPQKKANMAKGFDGMRPKNIKPLMECVNKLYEQESLVNA